jgi:hypothetical protein
MADSPAVDRVHFGFDRERLYLRLDLAQARAPELKGAQLEVGLEEVRRRTLVRVALQADSRAAVIEETAAGQRPLGDGEPGAEAQVELTRGSPFVLVAVPFRTLGLSPGSRIDLTVRVQQGAVALARVPADGGLTFNVPDDAFEAENWSA